MHSTFSGRTRTNEVSPTPTVDSLAEHSKIDCHEDPRGVGQGNAIHDVASIHLNHTRAANETNRKAYLMSLANNLAIRKLDTMGSFNKMQDRLKKVLVMEFLLREIEPDIAHGTISQRSALYLIINPSLASYTWRIASG